MRQLNRIAAALLTAVLLLVLALPARAAPTVGEEDIDIIAKALYGECRGVERKADRAAVVWCIVNRLDDGGYGDTLREVVTAPKQFTGYKPDNPVWDSLRELAFDVVRRWERETAGVVDVGRTLPKEYCFFAGRKDGRNYFRTHYDPDDEGNEYWDWSLPDPYEKDEREGLIYESNK